MVKKITYNDYVRKYSSGFVKVILDEKKVNKIRDFVSQIILAKENESHHKIDSGAEKKRWMTGFLGECAVEQYFGLEFIDYSVGRSLDYYISDLKIVGYDCGVKTVEKGKFPVIFIRSIKPEIIVVKENNRDNILWICGLATKEVLNKYQSSDLILSPSLRRRGTKTGFYGFHELIHPDKIMNYLDTSK